MTEKMTKTTLVRFTENEYERYLKLAEDNGFKSFAGFVRFLLNDYEKKKGNNGLGAVKKGSDLAGLVSQLENTLSTKIDALQSIVANMPSASKSEENSEALALVLEKISAYGKDGVETNTLVKLLAFPRDKITDLAQQLYERGDVTLIGQKWTKLNTEETE